MDNNVSGLLSLSSVYKKLIFIGGKGGVGKSSVASSIAYHLSRSAKCLLVSTDPAHSTSDSLAVQGSTDISQIKLNNYNLKVWELDSEESFEQFKEKHDAELRMLFDTSTYLDMDDINKLMSLMLPGIDEVMGLKSVFEVLETDEYDKIIVDTAPTGHALRLLLMPKILNEWIKVMASMRWKYRTVQKTFKGKYTPDDADDMLLELKRMVVKMNTILTNQEVCEFVLVTQPEKMIVSETKRLHEKLSAFGVSVFSMIINRLAPSSKDPFYQKIHEAQQSVLKEIESGFSDISCINMPLYNEEVQGAVMIETFEKRLFDQ